MCNIKLFTNIFCKQLSIDIPGQNYWHLHKAEHIYIYIYIYIYIPFVLWQRKIVDQKSNACTSCSILQLKQKSCELIKQIKYSSKKNKVVNFFKKNSPKEAQTLYQKKTWNSGPIYKLINLGTMLVSMSSFISENK